MNDLRDFYILGLPIETSIGECHFIKIKDYYKFAQYLNLVRMSRDEIAYSLFSANQTESSKEVKKLTLFEVVTQLPLFTEAYHKVLSKMFNDEGILEKVTHENFTEIRKLILDMNLLKEEKINPNPIIQKAIERSKRLKSLESSELNLTNMISSIVAFGSSDYEKIVNWTIYQVYMTFLRIALLKKYDTSTLFATVDPDHAKNIEDWSKDIEIFEDDNHTLSKKEAENISKMISSSH